jgi:hypothetical protein
MVFSSARSGYAARNLPAVFEPKLGFGRGKNKDFHLIGRTAPFWRAR